MDEFPSGPEILDNPKLCPFFGKQGRPAGCGNRSWWATPFSRGRGRKRCHTFRIFHSKLPVKRWRRLLSVTEWSQSGTWVVMWLTGLRTPSWHGASIFQVCTDRLLGAAAWDRYRTGPRAASARGSEGGRYQLPQSWEWGAVPLFLGILKPLSRWGSCRGGSCSESKRFLMFGRQASG